MEVGAVEVALMALVLHNTVAFMQGLPLGSLLEDIDVCRTAVLQYRCETPRRTLEDVAEMVMVLTGPLEKCFFMAWRLSKIEEDGCEAS